MNKNGINTIFKSLITLNKSGPGKKRKIGFAILFFFVLINVGCNNDPLENLSGNHVHFPIGKTSIEIDDLWVELDTLISDFTIVDDAYGGRWVKLAFDKLDINSHVLIGFVIRNKELDLVEQSLPIPEIWTNPSEYIDSDHQEIIARAKQLTKELSGVEDKARRIQQYVYGSIDYRIFMDCGLVPASETLECAFGTCINFARLFVALCRAINIPARSIWGALNPEVGHYNGHHNWAEFLGEDNKWHPVGLIYTDLYDLNDLRYLDLMYAPEENSHLEEYKKYTISPNGDYYFYDGSGSAVDGKLKVHTFKNNFPEEMELIMSYSIAELFE